LTPTLTDAQLVARCRDGDDAAWRQLVERFSRYVYAIAVQGFRMPEHDAEDIFQEVFARTYQRLDRLRDDGAIKPWLAQLTRNLCLDRIRETARTQPTDEELGGALDETLAQLDLALTVRGALDDLGEPCSELLDRFFCRDESYKTIGSALDLPPGTIASRISRCLGKLREQLEGRNESSSASGGR
jgi:RNA polymerase sigma-70 factor (ECF subfamily)